MNEIKLTPPDWWPQYKSSWEISYVNALLNYPFVDKETGEWSRQVSGLIVFPVVIVLLLTLGVIIFYMLTHWTRTARYVNRFPGPSQIPFIGNYNHMMCPPQDWQRNLSKLVEEYGRVYRLWFSYKPVIMIADGKVAEKVLAGYENVEKGDNYVAFHRVLGQGLITAPGKKWKSDRKLLSPGFGYQYFEGFCKIFNEQSRTMLEIFEETYKTGDEVINLLPFLARCTMDSVFHTVLGAHRNIQSNPEQAYAERVYALVHCTREKLLRPWLNWPIIWHLFGMGREEDVLIDGIMADLRLVIDEKFKEKEETNEITGTHTRPFIAFLMDAIKDKEDLAFQINTLCATGSETTSSGLNYLLFLLALNPECQGKVQEEIDLVLGHSDPKRDLTLADCPELKYTEMCIKEGLRLYPSVSGWFRKLGSDVKLEDGRIIPRGAQVAIMPWDIHRNPQIFPHPERFEPERFSAENRDKIGSSGWLAFSSGPRNCIGHRYGIMQMKIVLSHILRRFDVFTTCKKEDLRVIYGIVLEPLPEITLTLKPRQKVTTLI